MKKVVSSIVIFVLIMTFFTCYLFIKKDEEIEPEFVLTYAENQSGEYPTTQGAYKFAELVKERTEGKVLIEIKHSGELGTQREVIDQLQFGGIDLARISISAISDELSRMNVLQLPFLYKSEDQMWHVLKSEVGYTALNSLEKINLVGLSWYEAGTRSFYSSEEPIKTLEDLKGKTIRVQESELMKDWIEMLGGIPVEVPYSDVYSAFETGEIDVAENNWTSYVSEKHYEVAKYFTVTEHTRVPEMQIMSRRTWDQLPVRYRYIIMQCAEESAEYEKALWEEQTELAIEKAKEEGCVVLYFSEEEIQKCKDMVEPLYSEYCANFMYLIEDIQKLE